MDIHGIHRWFRWFRPSSTPRYLTDLEKVFERVEASTPWEIQRSRCFPPCQWLKKRTKRSWTKKTSEGHDVHENSSTNTSRNNIPKSPEDTSWCSCSTNTIRNNIPPKRHLRIPEDTWLLKLPIKSSCFASFEPALPSFDPDFLKVAVWERQNCCFFLVVSQRNSEITEKPTWEAQYIQTY